MARRRPPLTAGEPRLGYHRDMEPARPSPTLDSPRLPDHIRAFLQEPRIATIATINPDGSAHQAVVWYAIEGDDLLVNSRRQRQWPRNLARDGRISVAVPEGERPTHWVGIRGKAEFLRDGAESVADIQALARRYGEDPEQYAGQDRVTFRIVVASTFDYGADS
jgi:PPOX class probable F420-dependent enzyme